jgi:hypothetical protein
MKRAIIRTSCAALVAVLAVALAGAGPAQAGRVARRGVCVVVVKQGSKRSTPPPPSARGGRRSPRCRGPRGRAGPQGKAGPRGRTGAGGATGAPGRAGANGAPGRDGATGPQGAPGPASTGTRYTIVRATETTDSPTFVRLATPGPSVTVRVPESGLIQVAASVEAADDDGAVSLYEDGDQMSGQSDICVPGLPGVLFQSPASYFPGGGVFSTPGSMGVLGCGTLGAPGPVLFQTTEGTHTYELRYATCDCTPDPTRFSNRRLWVTPMP